MDSTFVWLYQRLAGRYIELYTNKGYKWFRYRPNTPPQHYIRGPVCLFTENYDCPASFLYRYGVFDEQDH
jgi:hypothetical protein